MVVLAELFQKLIFLGWNFDHGRNFQDLSLFMCYSC
jgi:hypothetical protein